MPNVHIELYQKVLRKKQKAVTVAIHWHPPKHNILTVACHNQQMEAKCYVFVFFFFCMCECIITKHTKYGHRFRLEDDETSVDSNFGLKLYEKRINDANLQLCRQHSWRFLHFFDFSIILFAFICFCWFMFYLIVAWLTHTHKKKIK